MEMQTEKEILDLIYQHGSTDGAHHKQWVLDQIVRIITKDNYGEWVAYFEAGDDGPRTYEWSEGVAP